MRAEFVDGKVHEGKFKKWWVMHLLISHARFWEGNLKAAGVTASPIDITHVAVATR